MNPTAEEIALLGAEPTDETLTVAKNVSTRYLAIAIEMIVGLVVLPFNVAHLGKSAYGLWVLTASVTAYFSILDMGYSGALVKFVAQYRAQRDVNGLNDIASTLFVIFSGMGLIAYGIFLLLALNISHIFSLSPEPAGLEPRPWLINLGVTGAAALVLAVGTAFVVDRQQGGRTRWVRRPFDTVAERPF